MQTLLNTKSAKEHKIIFGIILSACIIRIILTLGYGIFCDAMNRSDMLGDAEAYTSYGVYVAEVLTGKDIHISSVVAFFHKEFSGTILPMGAGNYQINGFAYLQALIYGIFGYSVFTVKILNSFFSVLTGLLIYIFAKREVNATVAVIAAALILFYPSLVIWSVTGLKDTLVILLITTILILCGRLAAQKMPPILLLLNIMIAIVLGMFVNTVRERVIYILMAGFVLSFLVLWFMKLNRAWKSILIVLMVILSIIVMNTGPAKQRISTAVGSILAYQSGQSNVGSNTFYKIYPDRYYGSVNRSELLKLNPLSFVEWVRAATKGFLYFGFAPFFFNIKMSSMLLFAYPQALINLFVFPFMLGGVAWVVRNRKVFFFPMLIFMALYWLSVAMVSGNMGTMIRHRDLTMPIYLLFSAIGAYNFFASGRYKK